MRDLNKVMVIGNLGKDPEMRFTASGTPVTSFSLAVNRSYSRPDGERHEETEWFNIVAWNKLAETCNQHLGKGRRVYIEGRFQTRSWEGQDGQTHHRTEIIASDVIFLDRRTAALPGGEEEDENVGVEELPF